MSKVFFILTFTFASMVAAALVTGQPPPPPNNEKQLNIRKGGTAELVPLVLEDFTVGAGATQKDAESVEHDST